jgi:protoporphyrinogen oxidase
MTQTSNRPCICVIGAGLTGLTAAHRLLDAGFEVIILESTLKAGGMLSSFTLGQEPIEYIYHHIFTSDNHVAALAAEMGLANQIAWYPSREALFSGGVLYPFSAPIDLLRFKAIPFWQRIKTGMTVLKAARISDWQSLESQTAADWVRQQSGEQSFDRLWKPLLCSKFEHDAEEISAVWIWNKFKLRGHSRDKHTGKSRLGYMKGGFGTLTDKLVKSLQDRGARIFLGYTATSVNSEQTAAGKQQYQVSCVLGNCSSVEFRADAVIATISGRQFANIASSLDLPDDYMRQVRALRYKGDLCMILRLKNSLSPFYWTTVCDNSPYVVVVEHTNLTGPDRYGGHVIYLSRYLDASSPLWTQPDGEIFRQFTQGLIHMYPAFNPADIIDWRLRRTRYAQPVISCGYSTRLPAMKTPQPGVFLAGMAQIYPEDRGMNYAIRLGGEAAVAVSQYFADRLEV